MSWISPARFMSLLTLNCPFLIFRASSIPAMTMVAWSKRLKPSIGPVRLLMPRWSCSTMLFRWFWCKNSRWATIVGMTFADHLFKRRHFDRLVIILCVRWYVRYKLSYRDLVEMMAERGLSMAHTTIMRWVVRFIPVFEQRWRKYSKPVGRSWRGDETSIKVKGEWGYLSARSTRLGGRSTSTSASIGT